MIFPRIIELDLKQSYKYRTILGKFAVVYTRTRFFNIIRNLFKCKIPSKTSERL